MTPDFRVLADAADVTERLRARLLELRLTDEAPTEDDPTGLISDTAELRFDDRAPGIALPRRGSALTLSLGYRETGLVVFGRYTVDEVGLSGPPSTLVVRARAAELRGGFKAPRTRSFGAITLGDLVATMAGEHGYTPQVSPALTAASWEHLDQTEESDLHLLTRLTRDLGGVVKPANGRLAVLVAGEAKAASGIALPPVRLLAEALTRWSVTRADRTRYEAVEARYRDKGAAADVPVTTGTGAPAYRLRHLYHSEGAAKRAAQAKLEALARGTAELSFALQGDVRLIAEAKVELSGVRDGVDGAWVVASATHTLSGSGYMTECRCLTQEEADA